VTLISVSSLISNKDRGLVEHLLELAMYLCKDFNVILEANKGRLIRNSIHKSPVCRQGTNPVNVDIIKEYIAS
jgi:hypothetical protein